MAFKDPTPYIKARYPDPSVLGERIFQSAKNKGKRWASMSDGFWQSMLYSTIASRPDTEIYLYAWHRAQVAAQKTGAQQTLGLKDSSGDDLAIEKLFSNQLLQNVEIVKGLASHLLPFQIPSVSAWIRYWEQRREAHKFCGALISDDMGLGKTVQAIEIVERILLKAGRTGMQQARVLILCRASLISNWADEIRRFSVLGEQSNITTVNSKVAKALEKYAKVAGGTTIASAGWFIVSQDYCWRSQILLNSTWDAIIYDEAHDLRGLDSKRGALCHTLKATTIGKLFMTGTPITNTAMDAYNFCKACLPEEFAQSDTSTIGITKDNFVERFTTVIETEYGPRYRGIKNHKELGAILSRFCIKRPKSEADKDMPPLFRHRVLLDCDPKLLVELTDASFGVREILAEYFSLVESGRGPDVMPPQVATIMRAIGVAKVTPIVELIKSVRESGETGSLVVFAHHRDVMDKLHKELVANGETISRIDGSTPTEKRGGEVRKFQDGITSIFLGQIHAAGAGLTLTRAKHTFMAEYDILPAPNLQAEARTHRIGIKKDDKVVVTYCVLADPEARKSGQLGVDEARYKIFMSRANEINKVFDEGRVTADQAGRFEVKAVEPAPPEESAEEVEARERYFAEIERE